MFNPFAYTFKLQQMLLENSIRMVDAATRGSLMLMQQQRNLFFHGPWKHRAEDAHEPLKGTPSSGPDLLDHYGKRSHDVDVERI